jgi:hypothetical protein
MLDLDPITSALNSMGSGAPHTASAFWRAGRLREAWSPA